MMHWVLIIILHFHYTGNAAGLGAITKIEFKEEANCKTFAAKLKQQSCTMHGNGGLLNRMVHDYTFCDELTTFCIPKGE